MDQLSTSSLTPSSLTPSSLTPSSSPQRRARLQRSERLHSDSHTQYSSWETLVKDSFEKIAWPIRITSCELNDRLSRLAEVVPTSSSATELISRRGVFSRRHYGSVDQLPQSELDLSDTNSRRFRLENGESLAEIDEVFGSPSTPVLENPEHQTRWYFKYFLGKLHQNYVGIDNEKNPYFLSIVSQDSSNKCMPLLRAILFRKQGTHKIVLPYNPNQKLTIKQILLHFPLMDTSKTPKELFSADIQKDLLLLEEQEGSVNFKFGVVYMKSGQTCDDEMLSNEFSNKDFDEFLNILGEKIILRDWERFRGGLDVKGDMTGKYSIYTLYEGHEIMFHVSTLLPFSRDNKQQVERKRHIGNDIVNIIFINEDDSDENESREKEDSGDGCDNDCTNNVNNNNDDSCGGGAGAENIDSLKDNESNISKSFSPNCIKSQFTHIFAVVRKSNDDYKLSIYCDENVPPFGPTLPNPPEFKDKNAFREFLLVKLINGEKATFQTPIFSKKRERTLEMLIKDLYEEYVHDTKLNMLNRRAFSEVLSDAPKTSRIKEDARQVEFVRIGQALKLEAIVRGDAPTSLASAGSGSVFKRSPWEPQCFYATFCHKGQVIGDSYGDDAIFLSVDEGTYLIKEREDQSQQLVFDKTLCVRQMSIIEDYGLMILRGGSVPHKDDNNRIYVFRLYEFENIEKIHVRSRNDVKDRRLEKTRGCHLYSILNGSDGFLRMVVCVNKKLLIYQWKYTVAWTSWCSNNETETIDGFIFIKEIVLHDIPTIVTILEKPVSSNLHFLICAGFKYHYEIICEQSGQSTKLHEPDNSKRTQTQLIAALDLCDGQEIELLLCYNHTCHFQKLINDNNTNEFDFHWNTSPTSIVCAFPYIIAFTSDSIEIRLLVNGNLVHTVTMADLQLVTSKKDIFFVTTAPEFIAKEYRIKGLENEQDHNNGCSGGGGSGSSRSGGGGTGNGHNEGGGGIERCNDKYSNERILEIKHKIEKINIQNVDDDTTTTDSTKNLLANELKNSDSSYFIINSEDNLNKFLPIPQQNENSFPLIQRAKSLQKPMLKRDGNSSTDIDYHNNYKRLISKSNSCCDNYSINNNNNNNNSNEFTIMNQQQQELLVPPNSPKLNTGNNNSCSSSNKLPIELLSISPTKRNSLKILTSHQILRNNSINNDNSEKSSVSEKIKPLRVFRIPLANLTGTHSHYHTHNSNKLINNFQTINNNNKILEDHRLEINVGLEKTQTLNPVINNNNNNNNNNNIINNNNTGNKDNNVENNNNNINNDNDNDNIDNNTERISRNFAS